MLIYRLRCLTVDIAGSDGDSFIKFEDIFNATRRQQSKIGPKMAPCMPMQNTPPAMANPVMYG